MSKAEELLDELEEWGKKIERAWENNHPLEWPEIVLLGMYIREYVKEARACKTVPHGGNV